MKSPPEKEGGSESTREAEDGTREGRRGSGIALLGASA